MAAPPPIAMEILAFGDEETLCRPCVDCRLMTGNFCDHCLAEDRLPNEVWAVNQATPLCSHCEAKHGACHYCLGKHWCDPPPVAQSDRLGCAE